MKWMKERDLLIAQTMAFVQSVTAKRPDADALSAAPPVVAHAVTPGTVAPPLPVPTVIEVPPAAAPAPAAVMVVEVPPASALPGFVKLDLRGDFGSEVRARVANFRANQQRFLREREEYCSSTMDKVRAAIRDNGELPRSGK